MRLPLAINTPPFGTLSEDNIPSAFGSGSTAIKTRRRQEIPQAAKPAASSCRRAEALLPE